MSLPECGAPRARSILVVDDEPSIRFALRRYFTRAGWEVTDAEDGLTALLLLLGGTPSWDVVLCDIGLPILSGTELYETLAVAAPEWLERLVLTSGDVSAPELAGVLARVRCAVVEKPFTLSAIGAVVAEVATEATARGAVALAA